MQYAVTFDYLCPFARNAAEAVLEREPADADWRTLVRPFSLSQVHLGEEDPPVWEAPEGRSGVLALQWGLAARDHFGEVFPAVHHALFAARHDHGEDINDEAVLRRAVAKAGGDVAGLAEVVRSGTPMKTLAEEHTEAVERWRVFGVPTFVSGEEAVFVRMMERGRVDDLERVLDMISWTRLNEFKRTRKPR